MTRRLTFRPAVADDLEEARRWYDERRLGLGAEFLDSFSVAVNDLVRRPLVFGFVHRDVRRAPMKRFPYGIFFRASSDEVVVLAVLHGRRSLRRLRKRS